MEGKSDARERQSCEIRDNEGIDQQLNDEDAAAAMVRASH
jgi:hypothetical protein